ncbi:DUF5412 family protein [Brevibacillus sp. BC25]|uniref:DUF5412 family protein n=1 Tax=Brevibacillus sp. BC25 TaxID=1144308 RepID=UPI00027137C1|nr:DUF5412 family protein [Brevibacillus sp. BC25]EJL30020.1 hypothetical protein PMI05_01636 [Brevibacillus sp. BC25]
MKKVLKSKLFIFVILPIVLLLLFVYLAFFSTLFLRQGELTQQINSPNNTYTAKVYRFGSEGGLRVDVNSGLFGDKLIYWSWKEVEEKVEWVDNTHISINNRVLDVTTERYDKRTMD